MKKLSPERVIDLVMLGTVALCAAVILVMGYNMQTFKNNVTDQFNQTTIQEEK